MTSSCLAFSFDMTNVIDLFTELNKWMLPLTFNHLVIKKKTRMFLELFDI